MTKIAQTRLVLLFAFIGIGLSILTRFANRKPFDGPDLSKLPANEPLVSKPVIPASGDDIIITVCNKSLLTASLRIQVLNGSEEAPNMVRDGKLPIQPGSFVGLGLGHMRRYRKHNIRLKLTWTRGGEHDGYLSTIRPGDISRFTTNYLNNHPISTQIEGPITFPVTPN